MSGTPVGGPTSARSAVAVVPVRDGVLPSGATDAVRAAGGSVVLVGADAAAAVPAMVGLATSVAVWDTPGFAPGAWAAALSPVVELHDVVVLPSSPDGRDLAPRLAAQLGRPVLAGAVSVRGDVVSTACLGGSVLADHLITGPVVVTFQPGLGHASAAEGEEPAVEVLDLDGGPLATGGAPAADATVVEVLPPDVTTMDLAEAHRILGGGAGLDSSERFDELTRVATALGGSMGATRVITDRGWVPHVRQIGTTGVVVDPDLYLAFGISGAVQHTAGLGDPDHIISVNTDPHCPMMGMADLAVVADANATLDELLVRLPNGSAGGA
ncbi:mycofactocin-associated electron transfer flavoprotein alpha subunit [Dermatobacter hominis]|uniref:mycofactocin-associated electron transfer flavoprotein alpha subunit n=1 Tax=Dermatobacter hominis TaxID=2884263 RepID=UPI001D1172B5|nr:mycofactocin-associated electron transfer flavoprotein alpha subunit [Dermatobacter hominis]UDY37764.1 mycofactocin-associated electron transfer flavoprotein alpha subunit [Dermatobacter hominis]